MKGKNTLPKMDFLHFSTTSMRLHYLDSALSFGLKSKHKHICTLNP